MHLKSGAAITTFLNKSLNQSNVGCHFYSICVNHLFYANDSVVIVTLLWLLRGAAASSLGSGVSCRVEGRAIDTALGQCFIPNSSH